MNANKNCYLLLALFLLLSSCQYTKQKPTNGKLSLNPKASELNVQLGMAYLHRGNMSRAKSKFLYAIEQNPRSTLALSAMAYYLESTDELAAAEAYHLQALSFAPSEGRVLNNYGAFLCRHGKEEKALEYLVHATEDMDYLSIGSAFENAGLCAKKIPDDEKALYFFKKAIAQDPESVRSLDNVVQLLIKNGDYPRAQSYYQRYAKLTGISPKSLWFGLKLARELGDTEEAESLAKQLITRYPDSIEAKKLKV